jgi:hypothetical protein
MRAAHPLPAAIRSACFTKQRGSEAELAGGLRADGLFHVKEENIAWKANNQIVVLYLEFP